MRRLCCIFLMITILLNLSGCKSQETAPVTGSEEVPTTNETEEAGSTLDDATFLPVSSVVKDNYGTYYEVFVYSFYDSDGDGIGDLNGLREKLDYIKGLGVDGIWLMPIFKSPSYHKYDTEDYYTIDPQYGTLDDFKALIAACDERGLSVILDLALNHTSSQHPWFLQAVEYVKSHDDFENASEEDCPTLPYYNFSKTGKNGYHIVSDTMIYYESQFNYDMPDLNLDCEAVRREFEQIASYWLDLGVHGFRLDAVKYYYSGAQESSIEALDWFCDYVKTNYPGSYIVGECWADVNEYSAYYASSVDSLFNFTFSNSSGVISKCASGNASMQTYAKKLVEHEQSILSVNPNAIDAPFYTNHDMGRSAGYYAGEESVAQTKFAHAMNLLMAGNAFLYYGEEIGMKGSKTDPDKRGGMRWSDDLDAPGICTGPPFMNDTKQKFGPLSEQETDPSSLYNYVKKTIAIKNHIPAIARGTTEFLEELSDDDTIFLKRTYQGNEVLLIFHRSTEELRFDVSSLSVNGKKVTTTENHFYMLSDEMEAFSVEGKVVTLPSYSVLVIE